MDPIIIGSIYISYICLLYQKKLLFIVKKNLFHFILIID